ncbi:MAG: hypothetical protein AMXMBFR57_12170 [Acidimicrobiia bacterium]|jgi:hypothetical protein
MTFRTVGAAFVCLLLCLLAPILTHTANAQATVTPQSSPLRVFVDCYECDTEYLRQNVTFIDYVRDRTVADVHLLVTTESTGGGGRSWTLKFIGIGRFASIDRTLTFTSPQTATNDDRRKEFARVFRLGIAPYALDSSAGAHLDVQWNRPATQTASPTTPARDPWNYWVFRTNLSGNRDGEESQSYSSYRISVSANRTTANWKINVSSNGNYNESNFDLGDGDKFKSTSSSWGVNSLIVKSLATHWSLGVRTSVSSSTFSNNRIVMTLAPALEYNFFPYTESARRSLTVLYTIGASRYEYRDITIFDKTSEVVPSHSLNTNISLRQPWGSASAGVSLSQHLNKTHRHRVSTYGSADVRLFKGFSLNVHGGYDRIRDQIGLRKGGATPEEVLLRRRQLATGHSYYLGFGLSYSFGSIFNSVVNSRFGNF